jgi:hypothetical protein
MKTKILFVTIFCVLFLSTIYAQKTNEPTGLQLPQVAKTYWCAKVADILVNPANFSTSDRISVGVRVKFIKQTIIPGPKGPQLCSCAFEIPDNAPIYWAKILSLRLIGIKYSETEINLLQYYGSTPPFQPYDYSGFSVIGFRVTKADLLKGYIDVWGWSPKEPLQCRDFTIAASLAVYNEEKYNPKTECHPHSDFTKSFKPNCPEVLPNLYVPKENIKVLNIPRPKIDSPDLTVTASLDSFDYGHENDRMESITEAYLNIEVKNVGKAAAGNFTVLIERNWACKGKGYQRFDEKTINGLAAGKNEVIRMYVDNYDCPRFDVFFKVTVDSKNKVAESNETNNTSEVKLAGRK